MKLLEIWGTGRDRGVEADWREQQARPSAERTMAQTQQQAVTKGYWLVSKEGKKLRGPFSSEQAATQFKTARNLSPDVRIILM